MKPYTSCINQFLQDHCEINKIVTTEQAGGKKDVWGFLELLVINKAKQEEVIKHKRSVLSVVNYFYKTLHLKMFNKVLHKPLINLFKANDENNSIDVRLNQVMFNFFQ